MDHLKMKKLNTFLLLCSVSFLYGCSIFDSALSKINGYLYENNSENTQVAKRDSASINLEDPFERPEYEKIRRCTLTCEIKDDVNACFDIYRQFGAVPWKEGEHAQCAVKKQFLKLEKSDQCRFTESGDLECKFNKYSSIDEILDNKNYKIRPNADEEKIRYGKIRIKWKERKVTISDLETRYDIISGIYSIKEYEKDIAKLRKNAKCKSYELNDKEPEYDLICNMEPPKGLYPNVPTQSRTEIDMKKFRKIQAETRYKRN